MAIFGIGCDYDGEYVGDKFYERGVACIGYGLQDKPYLYGIMREIGIGDIVFLKSFFQRAGKQVLRIKGIGIVTDNKLASIKNLGQCIEVNWLRYNAELLKELEYANEDFDAGVQRRTTIFKEYNPTVCKAIVELMIPG